MLIRVPPEGPPHPCPVLLVGEAPGYYEMVDLRPFSPRGKSGRELTRMLERVHLPRETVRLTNLVLTQPPERNGKQLPPSRADIARDTPLLVQELLLCRPKWIGAIGRHSARWLTGQQLEMEWCHNFCFPLGEKVRKLLRAEAQSLEWHYGNVDEWIDDCTVVPLYHPAAGLHNQSVARFVWIDIARFAAYVHNEAAPVNPVDQHPAPLYEGYDKGRRPLPAFDSAIGIDTEGYVADPFSIQVSAQGGTGVMIAAEQTQALRQLTAAVHHSSNRAMKLVGHNWLHDIHVVRALDVLDIDRIAAGAEWDRVEDTMLMSFCLGTLPLGLKPLSRRVSGAVQQSYSEVVAPAERRLTLDYVTRAIAAKLCQRCHGSGKVEAYGKSGAKKGQLLKRQDPCPNPLCVDGGEWPRRQGQLDYDWSSGKWKMKYGWETQRYLRRLKEDIEAGVFDAAAAGADADADDSDDDTGEDEEGELDSSGERKSKTIKQRWQSWDDDVREPVEAALGAMPTATLRDVPLKVATDYGCRDSDLTLRNFPVLDRMIDEQQLRRAYRLDMDVIPVAAEMERNGMAVDVTRAAQVERRLRQENDVILRKIQHLAKRPINPESGDQVAAVLFGERRLSYDEEDQRELQPQLSFDLEAEKLTRSGKRGATNDKVLEGLKLKYADRIEVVEFVQLTLDHRTRAKIIQFVEKLQTMSRRQHDDSWRIYTRIKPTTAATYRWASGDVREGLINLQNIPIRNKGGADLGRLVRECFIAPYGMTLCSADYGQIELRILAALSGDDALLRAFREGIDPHMLGASRAWRMDYHAMMAKYKAGDRAVADIRESAKNLNFGIVFGITPRGLQAQMQLRGLNYSLDECADLIRMWIREVFPGIGEYIEEVQTFGKLHGFARSPMGHMRHCPGVWSDIPSIREEALRQLVNFTIQCVPASTRIRTDQGFVRIGDFIDGRVWTGEGWADAVRLSRGAAEIFEVVTTDGAVLRCDANHKLLTQRSAWPEWVKASELRPGDLLASSYAEGPSADTGESPEDPEFWYWVGRYYGDGNLFHYRKLRGGSKSLYNSRKFASWAFGGGASPKQEEVESLMTYLRSRGCRPCVSRQRRLKMNGDETFTYAVRDRVIDKVMLSYGIEPNQIATTKRVADIVFRLERVRLLSFLQGYYDADGNRKRTPHTSGVLPEPLFTSVNLGMLQDMQILMRSAGIASEIMGPYRQKVQHHLDFYRLIIRRDRTATQRRIKAIVRTGIVEKVYTLSVDDEIHSYDTEGLVSKNCGAAEVMKAGLRDLWRRGKPHLDRVGAKLLMSVHDENLLELPDTPEVKELVGAVVETYMENPIEIPNGVEVTAKVKFAPNWGALKAA